MTREEAPQTHTFWRVAGVPALLLTALCGSAIAASGISDPCPEARDARVTDLHDVLADEAIVTPVADIESKPVREKTEKAATDAEDSTRQAPAPEFTTRLPGVSANDMPRFRRHMFRTDI